MGFAQQAGPEFSFVSSRKYPKQLQRESAHYRETEVCRIENQANASLSTAVFFLKQFNLLFASEAAISQQ
jgi:hypothetical protein